ncbi:THAP domain-containing protein 1-like [Fopius arisanus]|uniref:THAP domain-containing protein 1-like n=1 Tax=Fopius arisanus TaxID=64838 RepID=A0A0C9RAV4_9HYME|nr:PREDICTED: THAP domain-containing protein 1-like [Fopius arisanus]
MVRQCCIKDCKSEWWPGTELSFHSFPKREESRKKWLEAIPPGKLRSTNLNYSSVCSKHFNESCFSDCINTKTLRNSLKKDAVPTLFGDATEPEFVNLEMLSDPSDEEFESPEEDVLLTTQDVGVQTTTNKRTFENLEILRRRDKNLRKRLKRAELKIKELKVIVKSHVERTDMDVIADAIHKYIPEDRRDLFLNELTHHVSPSLKKNYELFIKDFAITIYLCSREAYDYLREKITLPHPSTLRKWMKNEEKQINS